MKECEKPHHAKGRSASGGEDGEKIDIKNLDYKLIKPLIWW
jgi:hypothetical protein